MRLVLLTFSIAVLIGYLLGGRLASLSRLRVRWAPVAVIGLAMQLVYGPGRVVPLVFLFASFAVLSAFALANIRTAGFVLVALGIALNFLVIALNAGMPVTRAALEASGQQDTLTALVQDGGAKHHLAGPHERFLFLGDVIAIPTPVSQAVSFGDLFTYSGVCWMIVTGMRRREGERGAEALARIAEPGAADAG